MKWKQILDYWLKISNNIDSRENAFLMKSTAHIKGAYRVKFVIISFAENVVSQNKNFFFFKSNSFQAYGFTYFYKGLISALRLDAHTSRVLEVQAQLKQLPFYEGHSSFRL